MPVPRALEELVGQVDKKAIDIFRKTVYNEKYVTERGRAAIVGEIAVPCHPQAAKAGMNSCPRFCDVPSAARYRR